ncbi:hypothetical protein LBMAG27_01350 [Bacteroidota bacterium]|nr:hypothetical protein LBMAG27_01350 [Bacteroidota bacterium]
MGSTTFCRGLIIFIFSTIFTAYSLKAQPIANFNINLPVPNCNPAVYSFSDSSTGVPPLSYQWNFGVYSGVNSIFQNPSTTYLNCGTYTVELIVIDGNGDADTATQSVTVWCSPTAIFNTADVSGCLPFPATFNSSGSIAGSGTLINYDWDFGDGYSGTGASPNHTYVDAGCKQVTLIVTNSYDCVADTTMTDLLCVYTPPQADFTSTIPTSCSAPFSVIYTDASTSGLAPYTYEWIFEGGDPATDTSANPTVTYNSSGNFSTTLIITDANGCTDTIVYNDYVVVANNTADMTLSAIQGCPPLTISLSGIASSTPIGYGWTISPSGTISNSTLQNASASITDTGTFSICLDVDFGNGCIASKCTTVITHPTPIAFYSIDGLLNTCLRPNPISFLDSSVGSNLSYAWSFPGGSPASANTSTPDTINYVACGTYSASLTVTDDFGCTDSYSTPNFMTTTCPVANFVADPTSGCVPLNVNFNSTSSTNNPVSWVWDFGDPSSGVSNTSTSQNPSHTYNNPGCYTISLITTNAEGCKDTVVMPNEVCAGTLPVAAFTATPTVNCANQPIYFTNQSTGTFNYTTYTWDFYNVPPYDNNSNATNPSHVYNDTGWFDITLIVSNYGCNDTLTIDQMVHLLPPVAHATLTRTCAQPYVITLNGTSSLGADHYTWVIPNGNPPVAFTPIVSVTYTATGNFTATLFVTNDNTGCTDQMNVSIPIRDVEANFAGTPLSGCAPLTSCMTNTSADAVSYAWLVTNSSGTTIATSTSTNPCFNLTTPGIYSVRLIATDMFGCKDTLLRPAYITVYAPVVDFSGLPISGCSPLTVDFTDLSTAPTSTPVSWSWNFGDPTSGVNNTSTSQNPSHNYNQAGWYTVTLSVTDDHGCTKAKTISNYIHVIHPEASFILTDTTVCQGTTACFINTSTGTGLTYDWDFGNGNTSTSSNPCYTYTVNGFYDITLIATDMYGCIDTVSINDYVNVTKPTANLIADTLGSSCPPLLVHFSNLSVDVDASSTYYWQFGDGQVSSAANPTHIYNIAGTFDVTLYVTNQNGCKDTIVFADYITIGGPEGFINLLPTSGCVPHYTCFEATSPTTISFTWNFGDGAVQVGGDSICHTYTSTGTFYSELILNDGVGCVYAIPVGAVVVNGANCDFNLDNPFLCDNGTTQFTDASYGTSPVSQWDWSFGDVASGAQNISTLQNPSHFFASPGTYSISLDITTVDGCTNSHLDTVIVQPAPVTYFARVDSSVCAPVTIHFFDETVSSSPIVNWYWNFDDPTSGVLNTDTLSNTLHFYQFPGTYYVTLTVVAENGCSDIISLPVYVHDTVIANAGPDQIICSGTSALLTASGGANYSWSPTTGLSNPNVSSPIASPTVTTSYTVTISNIYGCFDIDSAIVTVNPLPIVSSLTGNADTCADNHAQATVIASGGTPNYTYLWNTNPIQTSASVINLHGGNTYTVIITDANGCTVSSSLPITDLPGPNANASDNNSTCGYSNGNAWVTVTGGNGGNIYIWNTGATTSSISNLPVGNYEVTVTDQFGCSDDDNTNVTNIAGPTATISANNTTCGNSNSFVNLIANGGTNPKTYNWNTGATTQDLTNMAAGSYSVTVTDANSCTAIATTTFVNIPGPTISFSQVDATCQLNNGSIDVTLTNGTAPFNYNWNGFTYTTQDLTTIYSGNYNLTVTDANGCTEDLSVIISDTPIPSVAYITVPSTCGNSNGSIDVTVTGGISPYTYVWWNGETTEDLINFSAGSYGLTVIGANGCISNTIISLNDITAPVLTNVPNNNTCGLNNGSIDLSLAGGTVPFSYVWSGGETTQDINNLPIGTYAVTVTDGNGCLAFDNATLINIQGPTLSSSADSSTCGNANGGIDLTTTGGTLPFNYSWTNGATSQDLISVVAGVYSVTITDANACTATETQTINNINGPAIFYTTINSTCGNSNGSIDISVSGGTAPYAFDWNTGAFTSEDLTNIPSGIYTVIVTDQHNCTINAIITLNNTTGPTLSVIDTNTTCGNANGIIDLTVSGGTFPFVFDWNSGSYTTEDINNLSNGSYTVVVTDSNLCTATITEIIIDVAGPTASAVASDVTCSANNGTVTLSIAGGNSPFTFIWSNGSTTQNLNGLTTGIYDVTMTDANMCSATASAIVSDVPGPFSAMATSSATCGNNNGSIDLDVIAGIAPYNYIWSNGATTQDINGLAIGWYYATITDQNLCVLYDSAEVVNINGPSLVFSSIDETCGSTNGQVYLSVNNGTSPYTFSWSNGATTQNLNYVLAGSYSVTVNDANGCSDFTSTSIINISGPITVALGSLNSVCGNSNGSVWVQVTGGTAPYSYLWNTAPSQANDTAYNLVGGSSYSVTVTDSNSCVITGTIALINIASPTSSITKINCTCGEFNGAADLTTSAGTAPYSFTWSNGETTEDIDSLQPGAYSVTITDANGCISISSTNVLDIFGPYISYTANNTTCGNSNGSIDVTVLGGTAPFFYNWNSGQYATQDLLNLAAGSFTLELADAAGCQVDSTIILIDVPGPIVNATSNPSTCGYNNGNVLSTVVGGTSPFTYSWSNASIDSFANNLFAGTYTVQVTDSNGCIANASTTLTNIAGPTLSLSYANATCGLNNGLIDLTVTNGTAPFTYDWNTGLYNTQDLSNLDSGTYYVVVVDSNTCMAIALQNISSTPAPILSSIITNASCENANGNIDLTIISGTAPYNFYWNNGSTSEDLDSIVSGTYYVTVTDGVGCVLIDSFTVTDSSQPILALASTNANCGINDGAINLTITNGTLPLIINWSNGSTSEDLDSLGAGNYVVSLTDSFGCIASDSVIIIQNNGPELTANASNESCAGNDGAVNIDISGGTLPLTIAWSNGATTEDISGVTVGTYFVTVTDANGCTAVATADVLPTTPPSISHTSTNTNCGASTGTIDVSVFGGSFPLNYLWSNGANSEDLDSLVAGIYFITIMDAANCAVIDSITITDATAPTVAITLIQPSCLILSLVTISASGGTGSYSYNWSNGLTFATVLDLFAGDYTITVTDSVGCFTIDSITIDTIVTVSIIVDSTVTSGCNNSGAIYVSPVGGTLPFTYAWSNGATAQDITNISAGTYDVTVTDSLGCVATTTATISNSTAPTISMISVNANCNQADGSIDLTVASGTSPFSYSWSNGSTTEDISSIGIGTFVVTVTDVLGCSLIDSIVVGNNNGPAITSIVIQPNCSGTFGSISLTVTGGNGIYSYSWSNGETTSSIINLTAGNYSVTVTDGVGCAATDVFTINNSSTPVAFVDSTFDAGCNNTGAIYVSVSGGISPYNYTWSNGSTTEDITNLSTGTYTVNVTDSSGCTSTTNATINNSIPQTLSLTSTNESCNNANGTIDLTVIGGVSPFTYNWSNGSTTEDLTNISAGTYAVNVTDSLGCVATTTATITNSTAPTISMVAVNANCNQADGSVNLSVVGGTSPFSITWSNGSTTEDISSLAIGTYVVTVTDVLGCSVIDSIIVSSNSILTLTNSVTNSNCAQSNGIINLTVSGGISPYIFLWNNGSTVEDLSGLAVGFYIVTVSDFYGCNKIDSMIVSDNQGPELSLSPIDAGCLNNNGSIDVTISGGISPFIYIWSNGFTTEDINGLSAGIYVVTITDANGCVAFGTADILSVSSPITSLISSGTNCNQSNGQINLTATSGISPYTYSWSNGATTEDIIGISSGLYSVTVVDLVGCLIADSVLVVNTIGPSISSTLIQSTCGNANASIDITVAGGISPYTFLWNNANTTEDLINISAGNYSVTVYDVSGCNAVDSFIITTSSTPVLVTSITNASCGQADGTVNLTISGGNSPFSILWNNGSANEDLTTISAGVYSVIVTDISGCTIADSVLVGNNNGPSATYSSINSTCGNNNGAIDLTVAGGISPFTFVWSNGSTTEDLNSLLPGNYQVTITDASGCNAYATISIQTTLAPAIAMTAVSSNCNLPDGSIDLTVSGGTGPYTYLWSNNETTEDIDSLLAGYYTVSVTDAVNCLTIDSVFVSYTSGPIAMANVVQPNCSVSTGSIDLTVVGGTAPYSYSWNTTATIQDLTSLFGGVYSVTITDATGCQTFGSFSLISISQINLSVTNAAPMCQGGSEIISASGAVTYSWAPNFGLSTTTGGIVLASPTVSMTYTVTGFDSVGCFDTATVAVIINPLPSISSTTSSGLICYGDSALINVTGGSSLSWSPLSGLNFISMHSAYANPTSLTTYTITETTSSGCTTSTSVVVDVMPQYSISVSSPDTNLCSGESTTLIATGAISYTWSPATGLNATTGSNVTATPTQTTTYFVTATNANGCHVKDSIIVIVHPPVVVNVNPFNPTICLGSSINLTATGAVTYTWAPSIGLNVSTGSVVIATPTVTTTYTITGVDSFGCVGYNAVIVSIGTSLALYLNNSSPAICNGMATTLIVSGAFNANYSWTPSVSYLDSIGMTVSVNPNVNSTYTVVATDASGCTGSTTAVVTVNTPPTISSTNATACFGTSTALTVSGAVNYTWFPSVGLSNSTSNTQIAAPVSTTTYTIIGTDLNGCADTTQSVFIVNPLPVLLATPSVTSICNGSSATITATGALTYSWTPTSGLSATTGAFITAQPLVNTTYTIFGTDTIGCTNSVTAIVYVGAPVTIINTPIYPSLCLGDSLIITLSGASTYQWTPSTGLNTSTGSTVVATPTSSTNYLVIGTDANGCTGFTTIDITINPNLIIYGANESVCIGQNVTLYSSGAYFYMWTPDPTLNSYYDSTVIASPLISTTYTLTGMNMYGCMDTALYSVTVNPLPIVAVNGLQPDYCTNASIDTLIVDPIGGILFGTGVVGSTFDPAIAGTGGPYYVTYSYTDSFGCSNFDNDTTVVLNGALISVASANATICNGISTALTASGGISYSWSPTIGLSDSTGSVVTANPFITTTYFVNGTNANGCIGSDSVVVSVSTPIQLSIAAAIDSICAGTATTISVSGAITYSWSPSVQSSNINGDSVTVAPIVTTTYSISGIDSNGCFADTIVVINIIPQPNVVANNSSICSGDSATLIGQGATSYNWISPSSTNDSIIVQPIITTSYTVIGYANTCSDTAVAVVSMLAPPIVSVVNDTICSGSSATLVANGAANYSWLPIGTFGNTLSVSPTVNTTYTVIGNNGSCTDTTLAIVFVNPIPLVNFSGLNNSYCANSIADTLIGNPLGGIFSGVGVSGNIFYPNLAVGSSATITYSYTDPNGCFADTAMDAIINPIPVVIVNNPAICSGDAAILIVQGATTYDWISLASTNDSVTVQPLVTTSYSVIGFANTCSDTAVAVVSMLAPPTVLVNNANICSGTSATLIATGAANFTWYPGNMIGATVSVSPLVNTTYTVIGNNGSCTDTAFAVVTINLSPVATLSGLNNSYCTNNLADTLVGIPAGGIFSGVGVNGNIFNPSQVAGATTTVTYTYTDVNGCSAIDTQTTTMNGSTFITVNPSISTICNASTATIMASGANTYTWAPSTGLNVTTGDVVIASPSVNTTYTVSGISASGCAGQTTSEVIIAPNLLINIVATNDSICLGQAITMTATGGTNYSWSPSTFLNSTSGNTVSAQPTSNITYTVVATNATGCSGQTIIPIVLLPNPIVTVSTDTICAGQFATLVASGAANYHWSTNALGNTISVNPASTTAYIVIGMNGACADTVVTIVTVNPLPIINAISSGNFICNGGTIQINASGASTYVWTPSTGLNTTTGATVSASLTSSTTYTVSGIDGNGCANIQSVPVDVALPVIITTNSSDTSICIGQSVALNVNGASNFLWSPSTGLSSTTGTTVIANPIVTTTYTVIGTDINGCTAIAMIVVNVNPIPVIVSSSTSATLCSSSTATLSATGAANYFWSPSIGLNTTTGNTIQAQPNSSITYTVTGVDMLGCSASSLVNILVYPVPSISITSTNPVICLGANATLNALGSSTYSWSPSTNLNSTTTASVIANPTVTTTYSVSTIDSNGCTATSSSVVTVQPLPVIISSALDSTLCIGQSTILSVIGGTTYNWSPSVGLSATTGNFVTANPSVNTTYQIIGFDNFGCQSATTIPVLINPIASVVIPSVPVICPGDFATLAATGAVNYLWSTNALGDSIAVNPVVNTSYSVIGTDANGCTASDTTLVTINPVPTISAVSNQNNLCVGQTSVLTASGANYYEWYPAYGLNTTTGNTVNATPIVSTTYTIIGNNGTGCTDSTTIEIVVYQIPMAAAGPDVDLCEGGFVQLNANGGTSYEWSPQTGLDNPYISNPMASPSLSTTYIVNVGNQNGCYRQDTININIHLKPNVNAGPSQTVCYPNSTQLHGDGASFYNWSPADYLDDTALQVPTCTPMFDITYTLTVNDSFGCSASDTVSVKVKRPFAITADPDITLCRNDATQLNAFGGNNYLWTPSAGLDNPYIQNPTASPTVTTTYIVNSTDGICFSSSDTVVVTVNQLPIVSAGADVDLLYGSTYQLYGYTNASNVQWSPSDFLSCTSCIDPVVNHLNTPMTYVMTATDSSGCRAEAEVHISLTCNEDLVYVPNAFTPNGDNKNDVFRIRTYGLSEVKAFRVFNRWGEMVFETYDVNQGWDGNWNGQACAPAVFVYYLEGTCANGQEVLKHGNVSLIR